MRSEEDGYPEVFAAGGVLLWSCIGPISAGPWHWCSRRKKKTCRSWAWRIPGCSRRSCCAWRWVRTPRCLSAHLEAWGPFGTRQSPPHPENAFNRFQGLMYWDFDIHSFIHYLWRPLGIVCFLSGIAIQNVVGRPVGLDGLFVRGRDVVSVSCRGFAVRIDWWGLGSSVRFWSWLGGVVGLGDRGRVSGRGRWRGRGRVGRCLGGSVRIGSDGCFWGSVAVRDEGSLGRTVRVWDEGCLGGAVRVQGSRNVFWGLWTAKLWRRPSTVRVILGWDKMNSKRWLNYLILGAGFFFLGLCWGFGFGLGLTGRSFLFWFLGLAFWPRNRFSLLFCAAFKTLNMCIRAVWRPSWWTRRSASWSASTSLGSTSVLRSSTAGSKEPLGKVCLKDCFEADWRSGSSGVRRLGFGVGLTRRTWAPRRCSRGMGWGKGTTWSDSFDSSVSRFKVTFVGYFPLCFRPCPETGLRPGSLFSGWGFRSFMDAFSVGFGGRRGWPNTVANCSVSCFNLEGTSWRGWGPGPGLGFCSTPAYRVSALKSSTVNEGSLSPGRRISPGGSRRTTSSGRRRVGTFPEQFYWFLEPLGNWRWQDQQTNIPGAGGPLWGRFLRPSGLECIFGSWWTGRTSPISRSKLQFTHIEGSIPRVPRYETSQTKRAKGSPGLPLVVGTGPSSDIGLVRLVGPSVHSPDPAEVDPSSLGKGGATTLDQNVSSCTPRDNNECHNWTTCCGSHSTPRPCCPATWTVGPSPTGPSSRPSRRRPDSLFLGPAWL